MKTVLTKLVWVMLLASTWQDGNGQDLTRLKTSETLIGKMPLASGFAEVLRQVELSGGIINDTPDCGVSKPVEIEIPAGTQLSKALDVLSRSSKGHGWRLQRGVVVLAPVTPAPELLGVRISTIYLSDANNLDLSLDELLASKEVGRRVRQLSITLVSPEIGFQKLRRPGSVERQEKKAEEPLDLSDVSLLEALNLLVAKHKGAVWEYSEAHCNNRKLARFFFRAR